MILARFQGKLFSITVTVYAPNTNAEEAEGKQLYEDLQDLPEQHQKKKDVFFIIGDWNAMIVKKYLE